MSKGKLSSGVVHPMPDELETYIIENGFAEYWEGLTPLARNEWICWYTSAKKEETRIKRKAWMCDNFSEGKRRPCCWPGCAHREKGS